MERLYLVTGGAGFIGSHLTHALVAQGASVRVLDDLSTGRREHLPSSAELVVADVRDERAVREAVAGCDGVFHLAAVASVARSLEDPVGTGSVTHGGTVNVAHRAHAAAVRRVVLASSCAVYGDSQALPLAEESRPRPLSPYAAAKLASEETLVSLASASSSPAFSAVCLRFFNVYGPRQDPASEYSGVIARFITAALDGRPITVDGDGRQSRDFVYVEDVVRALLLAMHAPDERLAGGRPDGRAAAPAAVVNVGTGVRTSVLDLVAAIAAAPACGGVAGRGGGGRTLTVEHGPARRGDVRASQADLSRAHEVLGYEPAVPFAEGLVRTCEWYAASVVS
jgi:UDP-glucose 4-epimerase